MHQGSCCTCRHCVALADVAEDLAAAVGHKNPKLKLDALKFLQVGRMHHVTHRFVLALHLANLCSANISIVSGALQTCVDASTKESACQGARCALAGLRCVCE